MPDFGYDGDNFVIERSQDAPRNWKLLADFVYNKEKYEWLQNHLFLRKMRQKQINEEEEKRRMLFHRKMVNQKEVSKEEKTSPKFQNTEKEMQSLEELKKSLA